MELKHGFTFLDGILVAQHLADRAESLEQARENLDRLVCLVLERDTIELLKDAGDYYGVKLLRS